jgi:RNA polymerase sigma factor (sigma-70 family)
MNPALALSAALRAARAPAVISGVLHEGFFDGCGEEVRRRRGIPVPGIRLRISSLEPSGARIGRAGHRPIFQREGEMAATEKPSFEDVVREHGVFIRRTLAQLGVSARDLHDVEQEVWRGIDKGLRSFDPALSSNPASALRGWLFGICERQAARQRRAEKRRGEVLCAVEAMEGTRSTAASAEESLLEEERKDLLRSLLTTLEPRRRVVIIAYELEDISMQDVAAGMAISVNTAWNLRRLALEDLRAAYARLEAQERGALLRKGMQ